MAMLTYSVSCSTGIFPMRVGTGEPSEDRCSRQCCYTHSVGGREERRGKEGGRREGGREGGRVRDEER